MTNDEITSPGGDLPRAGVSIDFVLLGDFAQASGGKLTVVGAGWTLVNAKSPRPYPLRVPFGLGIAFLIPWNDTNRKHPFTFEIRGDAGARLAGGNGEVEAGRQTGMPPGMTQRVVIGIAGQMELAQPGTYTIEVKLTNDVKLITFEALPPPPASRIVMP
jgi:hypothetical protein